MRGAGDEMLVYIPARGGSKRIPLKNIRPFCDTPALAHVIGIVKRIDPNPIVVVSTDHEGIASVALSSGAIVYSRKRELSDDWIDLLTVVQADLERVDVEFPHIDQIACVLPTALLMSWEDLNNAFQLVQRGESNFVISIARYRYPTQRALRISESGNLEMISPLNYLTRSQDLEQTFHDAGQFYVGSKTEWKSRQTMFDPETAGILIEDWRAHDIDVEEDWRYAELFWKVQRSS